MTSLCLFTSKAVSLSNVGKDIAYVAQKKGYIPRLFKYIMPSVDVRRFCDRAIYIMTYSPIWATHWVLNAREIYCKDPRIPVVFYGTVEGRIKSYLMRDWMKTVVPYVANSSYTKEKLEEIGVRVVDVVYHGIVFDLVGYAKKLVPNAKKMVKNKVGEGIILGAILSDHPRKGLDMLLSAFAKAREQDNDIKLYLLTPSRIAVPEGVYLDNKFGKYTREEVLSLIGAFDYLIIPSFCEGFGLPLLEANAMGVPVIHCMYPPLSEITCKANITFPYEDIVYQDFEEGILYEYHMYNLKDLVDAILEASDTRKNKPDEYTDKTAKAVENAKRFDAMTLYSRLLDILNMV